MAKDKSSLARRRRLLLQALVQLDALEAYYAFRKGVSHARAVAQRVNLRRHKGA